MAVLLILRRVCACTHAHGFHAEPRACKHAPYAPPRHGFTLLEIVVAMTVFGIALTGLFPLLVILSRDLQPLKKIAADGSTSYRCETPARDGNIDGDGISPPPVYVKHVWYMTPSDDPWVRKLDAGARLYSAELTAAAPSQVTSATSPIPFGATFVQQDNYQGSSNNDGDGMFSSPSWTYLDSVSAALGGDHHRDPALPTGSTPVKIAQWTLTVEADGWYSIQATWTAAEDQATDVLYSVAVNGTPLTTVASVNQHDAPADITDADGRAWKQLTTNLVQLAEGDSIQVQLSNVRENSTEAGKFVVADGARIVQNVVDIVSVERSIGGINSNSNDADVTVNVAITVNLPQ